MSKSKEPNKKLFVQLAKFSEFVIHECCFGHTDAITWLNSEGIDGGDLQEVAEKLGIIHAEVATKKDAEDSGYEFDEGDTIYRFNPEILKLTDKSIKEPIHDQK